MNIKYEQIEEQTEHSDDELEAPAAAADIVLDGKGKAATAVAPPLPQFQTSANQQQMPKMTPEEMAKNQSSERRQRKQAREKFRERHRKYLQERGREAMKEQVEEQKSGKVHDINDQVQVVQKWWSQMQQEDLEEQREKG